MCRIAGIVNPFLSPVLLKQLVKGMCTVLKHGGPDDEGIYSCEEHHVVLGHRRLSLIDLTHRGHQPMDYSNGRYQITFNGEIYNYPELKAELKKEGYRFTTRSDTEVILASFAAWGTAAFQRFNGMFSLAIWDNVTANLYLARDASGIKPLYYAITRQGLAFASEIKAFRSISYLEDKNPNWEIYLMAYGHLPEPVTTLQHVQPLSKGCYLQYNTNTGIHKIEQFTLFAYEELLGNRQEVIFKIKETLQKAVLRHLICDAPIGIFLSGGIDSAIIAMLAGNKREAQLNSLSIYFDDSLYSEKQYQDLILANLCGTHKQFLLKQQEFHDYLPAIIRAMDLPGCDGINTWFISKYAKENGLKAVLSGIGGDELYGGYPSFSRINTALLLKKLPNRLLRAGSSATLKKVRRLCYLSLGGAVGKYLFLRGQFVPNEIAKHLNADESEIWEVLREEPKVADISHLTAPNQASWLEMNLYMQNQLLRDADVMSMAHGVEIRIPFLDKEFISLSLKVRSVLKYSGQVGKQLLIDCFKNILPEPVWNRPKMGFSFPFKKWLANDEYVKECFMSNGEESRLNYQNFIKGTLHWSQLMTLLLLEESVYVG